MIIVVTFLSILLLFATVMLAFHVMRGVNQTERLLGLGHHPNYRRIQQLEKELYGEVFTTTRYDDTEIPIDIPPDRPAYEILSGRYSMGPDDTYGITDPNYD